MNHRLIRGTVIGVAAVAHAYTGTLIYDVGPNAPHREVDAGGTNSAWWASQPYNGLGGWEGSAYWRPFWQASAYQWSHLDAGVIVCHNILHVTAEPNDPLDAGAAKAALYAEFHVDATWPVHVIAYGFATWGSPGGLELKEDGVVVLSGPGDVVLQPDRQYALSVSSYMFAPPGSGYVEGDVNMTVIFPEPASFILLAVGVSLLRGRRDSFAIASVSSAAARTAGRRAPGGC